MLIGINHVQITIPVGQEAHAKRFYCDLLGLQVIDKPAALQANGGFWLQAGNIQVHVGVEDGVDRTRTKAHVAYEVSSLAYWREKLQDANVALYDNQPLPGFDRFEFRDPFGNRVELIEKTA